MTVVVRSSVVHLDGPGLAAVRIMEPSVDGVNWVRFDKDDGPLWHQSAWAKWCADPGPWKRDTHTPDDDLPIEIGATLS